MSSSVVPSISSRRYSGFNPTVIPSCVLWVDAADTSTITLSGSSVTAVRDKAQNITLTTQGTSSLLTLSNSINSTQTLHFNNSAGNSVYLRGTLSNLTTGSFFVVWRAAAQLSADFRALYAWQSQGGLNFPVFGYVNSLTVVAPYTTFVGAGTPTNTVTAGTNYLTFYSWTGTTTNVGFNGATPTAGTQSAYSSSSSVFTIMGELGASLATCTGFIGEMIFYNTVLSGQQRQQVEGYLAHKWGLTSNLPGSHPYKSFPLFTRPFLPIDIQNCALWLDAADRIAVIRSGSSVTQWNDKSGNGRNATAGTSPTYNLTGINNLGVISFSGSSFLNTQDVYSARSFAVFLIVRRQASIASGTGAIIGGSSTTTNTNFTLLWANNTNTTFRMSFFGNNLDYTSFPNYTGSASTEPAYLITTYYTPGTRQIYLNGALVASDTNSTNIISAVNLALGRLNAETPTRFFNGFMGEYIVYNGALATGQRQQVESYLAWKWGLQGSLSSGNPFRLYPTLTPIFIPTELSNCAIWFDAADISTLTFSGSNVTQVNDKSGNGRNATHNATYTAPTTSTINGLTAINFSTTASQLSVTAAFSVQPKSCFVVFRHTVNIFSQTGRFQNFLGTNTSGRLNFVVDGVTANTYSITLTPNAFTGNVMTYTVPTSTYNFQTNTLISAIQDTTAANNIVTVNGSNATATVNNIAANYSTASTTMELSRADTLNVNYKTTWLLGEYIQYNGYIDPYQRHKIEGYLAWKWGLQQNLPTTHTYYSVRP
jgi:hypothetical protein